MTHRRNLIAAIATCSMIVAACGDDDGGGGGSAEEFCALFVESNDTIEFSDDEDPSAAIAALNALEDAAPSEIRGDVQTAVEGFTRIAEIDFENTSVEDLAALEEDFVESGEAAERVEDWVLSNCPDLPPGFLES